MIISVVVPVYNAQRYLENCINSVLKQSNSNWELLLIDDGSTDNSGIICDKYAEDNKNVLAFHKKNEGQFLTRRFGIQKSTGDYIGFLDADDFLDKEYVRELIDCVEKKGCPDVICFEYAYWKETIIKEYHLKIKDAQKNYFNGPESRKYVYRQMIDGTLTGSLWSKVFRAEIIKNTEIDTTVVENKRFAEDTFQSFNVLAHAESILYFNKILYFYRANYAGASQGFEFRELDYYNKKYVYRMLLDSLPLLLLDDEESTKKLLAYNFNYTVNYILRFYRSATTIKRRKEVVNYDWSTYLLYMTDEDINNNPYIRKSYIKVWYAFKKKRHLEIYVREKIKKIGWG